PPRGARLGRRGRTGRPPGARPRWLVGRVRGCGGRSCSPRKGCVMTSVRAADVLVGTLVAHGVDRAYCVAGESFLAALDALYDSVVAVVPCRHEASAAFAALADGKLTGRPGVCLVNRGPGASN